MLRNVVTRLARRGPTRGFIALPQGEAAPVIGGLIAANIGVWGMWQTCDHRMMVDHFTTSTDGILRRPHTLFTAMFSHRDGVHLFGNMLTLFFFGPEVVYVIGGRAFLSLYCGSGAVANACQLGVAAATTKSFYWMQERFLGASGAVNACVAWSVLASPWRMIVVFAEFIPLPLPAILYGGLFIAKDAAPLVGLQIPYLSGHGHQSVAHGAHVAGAAVGAAHYLLTRRAGRFF